MIKLPRPNIMKESTRWNKHSWMNWLVGLVLLTFFNQDSVLLFISGLIIGYALSGNVMDYFKLRKRDESCKTKTMGAEHAE